MVIARSSSLLGKITILVVIVLAGSVTTLGRTIYVDDDVPADFNNIQAAIFDANDGDIVEVKQGTYTGAGNRDIDFLGKAIIVRSTNPQDPCVVASTVIDCQGAGRGFYFHSGEEANSILDGLKITNGYATISSPGGSNGGGIYCGNQSVPTIANCDISNNTAVGNPPFPGGPPPSQARGGGIFGCNGTIINCKINGNTATGGGLFPPGLGGGLYECSGSITNCIISGNKAYAASMSGSRGGGLYACDGSITNCTISGNTAVLGGGLYSCNNKIANCIISGNTAYAGSMYNGRGGGFYACDGTITNCTISGNTADRGLGGGLDECNGMIINCSISGNTAANGGGLYRCNNTIANCIISGNTADGDGPIGGRGGGLHVCNGTIENCTISGNSADGGLGGGLSECNGTITNCIIWENLADVGPELYYSSDPNYSCIRDWLDGGIGNIDADPCFADVNNGDYHLKSQLGRWDANSESWMVDDVTSPCIDSGNPVSPIGLEPFPNGGLVNMGAYGRTSEASKSYFGKPLCETIVAGDVNGDCLVNFLDFRLMAMHWCEDNNP